MWRWSLQFLELSKGTGLTVAALSAVASSVCKRRVEPLTRNLQPPYVNKCVPWCSRRGARSHRLKAKEAA